ncbi:hypothetical protein SteCoe_23731 [Stentor coeruleus]|uniref:Ion transport domain-containing protein n=1 Tax=Stentor coeruleus TaxID=5963 RepID=A0A1R2BJB0_9CILI|nr:hypothetical protein SteCoe_23731 [Stentor coeruleus]
MMRISDNSYKEDKDFEEERLKAREEYENENRSRQEDMIINRNIGYKRSNSMKMMDFNLQGRAKRLENIYALTPMISRMNSSIRISRKLIAKLQSEGDLVPIIHYTDVKSTSCKDVYPEDNVGKFIMKGCFYEFSYRKPGENDYVKELFEHETEKVEMFCENNKLLGSNQKIIGSFSGKHSARKTFFKMKVNAKDFVEKVHKNDLHTLKIVADQSEVNYDKSCVALENSLSLMKYTLFEKGPGIAWAKFITPLQLFISNKYFNNTIYICIISNTIVLSIDHYDISINLLSTLNTMNTIFTFIFGAELLLRILSLGLNKFSRDFMNYLDFVIVASSLIEFSLLSGSKSIISAFRAVRIFKLMRVIRVAKLFRYLKSMRHIIFIISKSISKFAYVAILLFLFVIVWKFLVII